MTHQSVHSGPDSEILAAGAVLYRHAPGGIEVALIHRRRHDDWTFPKGKLEPGEHVIAAAVREVREETGISPVLGRPLATVRYQVEGRPKRVDYWAAPVDAGSSAPPFVPNQEVDALEWLPSPEAATRLTYAHDQRLLDLLLASSGGVGRSPANPAPPGGDDGSLTEEAGLRAAGDDLQADEISSGVVDRDLEGRGNQLGGEGSQAMDGKRSTGDSFCGAGDGSRAGGDTVPCILLRHASAGHKSAWHGDDLLRPLDAQGVAEAQTLASLLACYGPARVISSPAERCQGTVRPYAGRIGVAIETEPVFTVQPGDGEDLRAAAQRRTTELLAHPSPMVICAHRENISVLLSQARAMLPTLPMPTPSPDDPAWRDVEPHNSSSAADWSPPKGGFWVLHIANGQLSALEHHDLTS